MARRGRNTKRLQLGPTAKKILLLLEAGLALGLTANPNKQFRIARGLTREWDKINRRTLYQAIRNLYASKLISYKADSDGTVTLTLTKDGKTKTIQKNLDRISITAPKRWDGLWRLVIFDIPEHSKQARDALAAKLKQLGFYRVQKSVFIHPYPCEDEIDFLVELFGVRAHVRLFTVKETDIDLELKHHFQLI